MGNESYINWKKIFGTMEKDILRYSPSNLSMINLSHNCNFCEIQLKDLSRLLTGKSFITQQNELLKEWKSNTNTESVPVYRIQKFVKLLEISLLFTQTSCLEKKEIWQNWHFLCKKRAFFKQLSILLEFISRAFWRYSKV